MPDITEIILQEVRETKSELRAHRLESNVRHDNLELRVRGNERWIANANGKITAFGAIGLACGSLLSWIFSIVHKSGN